MDAWLLFGLVLPFVGFVLSILEELVKEEQNINEVRSFKSFDYQLSLY